MTSRDHVTGS